MKLEIFDIVSRVCIIFICFALFSGVNYGNIFRCYSIIFGPLTILWIAFLQLDFFFLILSNCYLFLVQEESRMISQPAIWPVHFSFHRPNQNSTCIWPVCTWLPKPCLHPLFFKLIKEQLLVYRKQI